MPETTLPFDLHRRGQTPTRRTAVPPYKPGELDPMLARKPVTIAPGRFLMLAIGGVVGLCASANFLYDLVQKYNDQIVAAMVYCLPLIGVLALGLIARIVQLWRRNSRRVMAYEASLRSESGQIIRDLDTLAGELIWQKHEAKLRAQGKLIPAAPVAEAPVEKKAQQIAQKKAEHIRPFKPHTMDDSAERATSAETDFGLRRLPTNRPVPKIERRRVMLPQQQQEQTA